MDEGLAAADREEFVDHHEIRRRIDDRYPGRYCASSGPGPPPTTLFKFAIAFKQTTELAQRVVWLWASLSALNRYSGFHCAAVLVGRPVRASWLVPGLPYMAIYRVRRDRIEIAAFCTVRKNGPEPLPLAAIVAGMMEVCE